MIVAVRMADHQTTTKCITSSDCTNILLEVIASRYAKL